MTKVEIVERASDDAIADWIEHRLQAALSSSKGRVAISVPGGSTPFPIFALLAARDLDWQRIDIWPGDDRLVAEDHAASNTGKIRALFEPLGAHIIRLPQAKDVPHFALVWLGMGADGHIASLFPNSDPQVDAARPIIRLTPDPLPPEAPFDRITLTIPALLDSDAVMFVLRGAEKRAVFDAAMRAEHDLPIARLLGAAKQMVTCFS